MAFALEAAVILYYLNSNVSLHFIDPQRAVSTNPLMTIVPSCFLDSLKHIVNLNKLLRLTCRNVTSYNLFVFEIDFSKVITVLKSFLWSS